MNSMPKLRKFAKRKRESLKDYRARTEVAQKHILTMDTDHGLKKVTRAKMAAVKAKKQKSPKYIEELLFDYMQSEWVATCQW